MRVPLHQAAFEVVCVVTSLAKELGNQRTALPDVAYDDDRAIPGQFLEAPDDLFDGNVQSIGYMPRVPLIRFAHVEESAASG